MAYQKQFDKQFFTLRALDQLSGCPNITKSEQTKSK